MQLNIFTEYYTWYSLNRGNNCFRSNLSCDWTYKNIFQNVFCPEKIKISRSWWIWSTFMLFLFRFGNMSIDCLSYKKPINGKIAVLRFCMEIWMHCIGCHNQKYPLYAVTILRFTTFNKPISHLPANLLCSVVFSLAILGDVHIVVVRPKKTFFYYIQLLLDTRNMKGLCSIKILINFSSLPTCIENIKTNFIRLTVDMLGLFQINAPSRCL